MLGFSALLRKDSSDHTNQRYTGWVTIVQASPKPSRVPILPFQLDREGSDNVAENFELENKRR